MDLNKDGRVGGGGVTDRVEKASHVNLNRDGVIGGGRAPTSGGFTHLLFLCNQREIFFNE